MCERGSIVSLRDEIAREEGIPWKRRCKIGRGRTCVGWIDWEEAIGRKLTDASGAQEEPETLMEA